MGHVLVVARRDDGVARRLHDALVHRGAHADWLTGPEAARTFTVRVDGAGTAVTPDRPIFVRPSAWWDGAGQDGEPADPDASFLRGECFATFWAAAALCRSPVLNRPDAHGTPHKLLTGQLGGAEAHVSGKDAIPDHGTMWGEDAEFRRLPLDVTRDGVPVRARRVAAGAAYEIVTIVGGQAFAATTDRRSDAYDLPARSLALAHRHRLQFATVTWEVADAEAMPVCLNPAPGEGELRYRWADVLDALCRTLLP